MEKGIMIVADGGCDVMTSIEIAELTGKMHKHVVRDIKVMLTELYCDFDKSRFGRTYLDSLGRTQKCFSLGKTETLTLISGYNIKMRNAIIVRWQELEEAKKPKELSRLDILKMALDSEEKVIALEVQVEKDKPKVVFAEVVEASVNSISVGAMAKLISNGRPVKEKIGSGKLFALLRDSGFVMKRKSSADYNLPYQYAIDRGLLEVKETSGLNVRGMAFTSRTTMVTGKGQLYFVNKFNK